MAEQDESQKTEEPTAKRLEQALKKGNVVSSQELKSWFLFTAVLLALWGGAPLFANHLLTLLQGFYQQMPNISTDGSGLLNPVSGLIIEVFILLLFPFAIFVFVGIVSNMAQHPTVLSFEKIKPDLSKLSPIKGLKKFVSSQILVDAAKNILKLAVVSAVVFIIVWPQRDKLDTMMFVDLLGVLSEMHVIAIKLLLGIVVFLTIVGALDYIYQKWKHMKQLRMTKQEVKDERKQAEGDPLVKGKIRAIRMERARERMMANVPFADVVVTNPTHYAIALEYKHGEMDVPKLTAKGVDSIAQKIREIADENKIPIVENPPLARALYAAVEVDEEISPEYYKPVAEVIGYVMKLRRSGMAPGPKSRAANHGGGA